MASSNNRPGKGDNTQSGDHRAATDVVHLGRDPDAQHGFVNPPVYRGSTVLFPTLEAIKSRQQAFTYGRRATPTTLALEDAIAKLDGGVKTILTSSGLGAVSAALLALVESGDHILITDSVYQPTRALADGLLRRLGVETEYYDPCIGGDIARHFKANTKLVFVESPGSLTFEMQDIPAIAKKARARDIWVVADNTWASPIYCKPLALGADITIQAATKYIVGHADALLGTVTGNARAASALDMAKEAIGTCPGSEETYLGLRGLRTLEVRLARHAASGLEMATWLAERDEVQTVLHPGLKSHPGYDIFQRDFVAPSGLFSIILKPVPEKALAAFLDELKFFGMGYSWGGFESLVIPFNPSSYRTATKWPHKGWALRFHIGLESVDDLKADLEAGFERLKAALG